MTVTMIRKKDPKTHQCDLPGFWRRSSLGMGIGFGAIVRCDECDRLWEWRRGYSGNRWAPLTMREAVKRVGAAL